MDGWMDNGWMGGCLDVGLGSNYVVKKKKKKKKERDIFLYRWGNSPSTLLYSALLAASTYIMRRETRRDKRGDADEWVYRSRRTLSERRAVAMRIAIAGLVGERLRLRRGAWGSRGVHGDVRLGEVGKSSQASKKENAVYSNSISSARIWTGSQGLQLVVSTRS